MINLKAKGLYTFPNNLGELPPGALLEAENVVIDRDGVIEPRRGFKEYGDEMPDLADRAKQLLVYKNRILRHFDDVLQFDDGSGGFTAFSGSFSEVVAGLRIKGTEANGNFYFTTSTGIQKISAPSASAFTNQSGYIKPAGVVKALDIAGSINYSVPGFLEPTSKVAYRVVFGIVDDNNNEVLGAPSQRLVLTNYSESQSATVDLVITVPSEITTTDFFYQIYRTQIVTGTLSTIDSLDPGDEMNLVFEDDINSEQLAAQTIEVNDITPESFREGALPLYTNPVSGEGILQSNDRPPLSTDINLFRNSVFYSNTKTRHRLSLNLLGLTGFVSGQSELIISNGTTTNEYTFVGVREIATIQTVAFAAITDQDFFLIWGPNDERAYFVWYDKTGTSLAPTDPETDGKIEIRVDISASVTATDVADATVAAINAKASVDFSADNIADLITVTYANNGAATDVADSVAKPTGFSFTTTQQGDGEDIPNQEVLLSGLATPAQQVDDTARSLVRVVNRTSTEQVDASYLSSPDDVPGAMTFERRSITDNPFYIAAKSVTLTISSITTGSTPTITTTTPHNLSAGDKVSITDTDSTPVIDGFYTVIAAPTSVTFTISVSSPVTIAGANGTIYAAPIASKFSPPLPISLSIVDISTGLTPTIETDSPHNLVVGSTAVIYNTNSTPIIDGTYTVLTVPTPTTFTISVSSAVTIAGTTGTVFNGFVVSDNEIAPNRIYFSKYQQPDAVPIVNFFDVGPKDKQILRILPLRDSLFILKEDGVYRLTGDISPNFSVFALDNTVNMSAPDTAVVLDNEVYTFTDESAVVKISETGVSIISRPIEDQLLRISTPSFTNVPAASFGVGYHEDKSYLLFTVTTSDDEVATQCFRYNSFTNTWTKWDMSKTCGIVNDFDGALYLGASDENFIEIERKDLTRKDHADREFILQVITNGVNDGIVELSSVTNLDVGDTLVQIQYVTISEFNRLLKKLDLDFFPGDDDYFSTLGMVEGDDLTSKMSSLVAKLNADPNLSETYVFSGATDFETIQEEFNVIIDTLNVDTGTFYHDYQHSEGTVEFESSNLLVNIDTNEITLQYNLALMAGDVTIFKGIPTSVIWAPQDFGDASIHKQVREGTILFEFDNFTTATISYATDLNPGFDDIDFTIGGLGDFGFFPFGNTNFGGLGSSVPIRVLTPREKQRCRFIKPKFDHVNAREKYSILGFSLDGRQLSERAYR